MAPKPGASRQMPRACSHPVSESGRLQVRGLLLCSVTSPRAALPGGALPLPTLFPSLSSPLGTGLSPGPCLHGSRGAEEEQQQVKKSAAVGRDGLDLDQLVLVPGGSRGAGLTEQWIAGRGTGQSLHWGGVEGKEVKQMSLYRQCT